MILLGTPQNAHYHDLGVEFHDYNDFFADAAKFEHIYIHCGYCTSRLFEIFCFQRWLILREFLTRSSYSLALHIDSDVLLFSNVQEEGKRFRCFDLTLFVSSWFLTIRNLEKSKTWKDFWTRTLKPKSPTCSCSAFLPSNARRKSEISAKSPRNAFSTIS